MSRSSSEGSTEEPSKMRSVPSGSSFAAFQGWGWTGVDLPENGSKPEGQPNPRLLISPVRTTRSASGLFSVRSYLSCQSRAGSPVAETGEIGPGNVTSEEEGGFSPASGKLEGAFAEGAGGPWTGLGAAGFSAVRAVVVEGAALSALLVRQLADASATRAMSMTSKATGLLACRRLTPTEL